MKYLKLMEKRFKEALYHTSNWYFFILNTNKPNPLKRHLYTRFWLDKSYICNETLRITQLFEHSPYSEENLKILKTENM